jgi:hypothetical protein
MLLLDRKPTSAAKAAGTGANSTKSCRPKRYEGPLVKGDLLTKLALPNFSGFWVR